MKGEHTMKGSDLEGFELVHAGFSGSPEGRVDRDASVLHLHKERVRIHQVVR